MFKRRSKEGRERDFFKLLTGQAQMTLEGVTALEEFMAAEDPEAAKG